MIAGIHFQYTEILKKAKKVDREISLSSRNVKDMKKIPYSAFKTGFFIAVIVWLCSLIGVIFSSFSILDSIFTSVFVFSLVSFVSLYSLMKKMDLSSYYKLKKIRKKKYQVYEYIGHIDGIYDSIGVSESTNMKKVEKSKSSGFILMMDGEKIYINRKVYEDIKNDNAIRLYIAKIENMCVLFDYEKK